MCWASAGATHQCTCCSMGWTCSVNFASFLKSNTDFMSWGAGVGSIAEFIDAKPLINVTVVF